jgi:hypothetical protein
MKLNVGQLKDNSVGLYVYVKENLDWDLIKELGVKNIYGQRKTLRNMVIYRNSFKVIGKD